MEGIALLQVSSENAATTGSVFSWFLSLSGQLAHEHSGVATSERGGMGHPPCYACSHRAEKSGEEPLHLLCPANSSDHLPTVSGPCLVFPDLKNRRGIKSEAGLLFHEKRQRGPDLNFGFHSLQKYE